VIGYLQGTLLRKDPDALLVLCGGVGYRVHSPLHELYELEEGTEVSLHVHTHVRETAIELFGFSSPRELQLFERLIGVSRVGPRTALAMLSSIQADSLLAALRDGDVPAIAAAPGIGRKTAERLHLELRDKLADLLPEDEGGTVGPKSDVISALVNLGYSQREAMQAAEAALEGLAADASFEEALRLSLGRLSGRR